MGNFQVTTLTTCWKFFLQTVHEKGFLKASERDPKKIQRKKKVAVLCNAEKNSIKRI
jgi:ribosomal protein L36